MDESADHLFLAERILFCTHLAFNRAGAFEQNANVAALKANIAAVEHLLSRASNIAQTANNLFPQLDVDSYDWITDSERDFPMVSVASCHHPSVLITAKCLVHKLS